MLTPFPDDLFLWSRFFLRLGLNTPFTVHRFATRRRGQPYHYISAAHDGVLYDAGSGRDTYGPQEIGHVATGGSE